MEKNEQNSDHKDQETIGGIFISPSPTDEQFQGLPLESLIARSPIDLAIEEENERIKRTKKHTENE